MISNGVCNNSIRLGGFGPMFNGNHLTTCFNDVILLPLPTWVLLLAGIPYLFITYRSNLTPRILYQPFTKLFPKIILIIYRLLVVALLLMDVLEVVRLGLSNSGIGLLPFNIIGVLIVIELLVLRKKGILIGRELTIVLLGYWGLLWIFQSVKVSTLIYVENLNKSNNYLGPSMYPDSDKSLDNYVILGLYVVLFLYEMFYFVFPRKLASVVGQEGVNSREGSAGLVGNGKEVA